MVIPPNPPPVHSSSFPSGLNFRIPLGDKGSGCEGSAGCTLPLPSVGGDKTVSGLLCGGCWEDDALGGERPPLMEDLLFSGVRLPGLRQEGAAWLRGAAGPSSTRSSQNRVCSETPPLSGERDPRKSGSQKVEVCEQGVALRV